MSHLSITKASLTSAVTFVVGNLIAFLPTLGPDKQLLISAGTTVIAAVFLIANAIHHLADSNVSARDVEARAVTVAKLELGKVDLNSLAANAVNGSLPDVPALVKGEVGKLLAEMFNQPVPVAQPPVFSAQAPVVTEPIVTEPTEPAAPPVQVFPAPVNP